MGRLTCYLPDRISKQLLMGGQVAYMQCELPITCRQTTDPELTFRHP